jgi:hypothetical protein
LRDRKERENAEVVASPFHSPKEPKVDVCCLSESLLGQVARVAKAPGIGADPFEYRASTGIRHRPWVARRDLCKQDKRALFT